MRASASQTLAEGAAISRLASTFAGRGRSRRPASASRPRPGPSESCGRRPFRGRPGRTRRTPARPACACRRSRDPADRRRRSRTSRAPCPASARHRQRAVLVRDPGHAGPFERNRREELGPPVAVRGRLDHRDLDRLVELVVRAHRAMEPAAVEEAGVDVLQKVGGRDRRTNGVDLDFDLAEPRSRSARGPALTSWAAMAPPSSATVAATITESAPHSGKSCRDSGGRGDRTPP